MSKGKCSRDGDRGRRLKVSYTARLAECSICNDRVIEDVMDEHIRGCSKERKERRYGH